MKTKRFTDLTVRKVAYKPLIELSDKELVQVIVPRYAEYEIPIETSKILLDGNITGKTFIELKYELMENLVPLYTNKEKDSILYLRNDILEEEENMEKNRKS